MRTSRGLLFLTVQIAFALLCYAQETETETETETELPTDATTEEPIEVTTEGPDGPTSGFVPRTCYLRYDYVDDDKPHMCDRECSATDRRHCYYETVLETFEAHNPLACGPYCAIYNICDLCIETDGVRSDLLVANYKHPSKPLVACANDFIQVVVVNNMLDWSEDISLEDLTTNIEDNLRNFGVGNTRINAAVLATRMYEKESQNLVKGEPTTTHWHGMLHHRTPHHDGVPHITQEVIEPGMSYRYLFNVSHAGTFFMHSHVGLQRGLGLAGAMVFRELPEKNAHLALYDHDLTEHIVFVTDYGHQHSSRADILLVNGVGRLFTDGLWQGRPHVFKVEANKRYRFRVIFNGINNVQLVLSIDNHDLSLIAVDGNDVEPRTVNSIILTNGERADFILETNQDVESYYMRLNSFTNPSFNQIAIIQYAGAELLDPYAALDFVAQPLQGVQFNTITAAPGTPGSVAVAELIGIKQNDCINTEDFEQYFLQFSVSARGFQINGITNTLPSKAYLMQFYDNGHLDETNTCNAESLANANCDTELCECEHVVKLKSNRCYEFVLTGSHPFHLHGFVFYVVASGVAPQGTRMTKETFLALDADGKVERNLVNPPAKDVHYVTRNGYAVVRFCTDNPGVWFAHCHIELHSVAGMSMTFIVGEDEEIKAKKPPTHNAQPFLNNECFMKK